MITDINSEDNAVQRTFAEFLKNELGWGSAYAWNQETFGVDSLLNRESMREVVLSRDLRTAINRLNHDLPASAVKDQGNRTSNRHWSNRCLSETIVKSSNAGQ